MGCFSMSKGMSNYRYSGELKQKVVETMLLFKDAYYKTNNNAKN